MKRKGELVSGSGQEHIGSPLWLDGCPGLLSDMAPGSLAFFQSREFFQVPLPFPSAKNFFLNYKLTEKNEISCFAFFFSFFF